MGKQFRGVSRRSARGLTIRYEGHPWPDGSRRTVTETLPGVHDPSVASEIRQQRLERITGQGERGEHVRVLEDLWNAWWFIHAKGVEANTVRNYAGMYRRDIHPRLGATRLSQLTRPVIFAFFDELLARGGERGQGLEPRTVHGVRGLLHLLLQAGVDRGWLEQHPGEAIKLPMKKRNDKPAATPGEVLRLLPHVSDPMIRMAIELMFGAGLRLCEALALHETDVYPTERMIHVQRAWITWAKYEKRPKNNKGRVVALPAWLAARLVEHQAVRAEVRHVAGEAFDDTAGLLCSNALGGHLRDVTVRRYLARACRAAGVRHLTPYDLRAGYVTLLRSELEEEEELDALGRMVGHSQASVTDGYDRPPAPRVRRSERVAADRAHQAWMRSMGRAGPQEAAT
jgi:integrase